MDHAFLVRGLQSVGQLQRDRERFVNRYRAASATIW